MATKKPLLDKDTLTPRKVHLLKPKKNRGESGKGPFSRLDLVCKEGIRAQVKMFRGVLDYAFVDFLSGVEEWREDETFKTWLTLDNASFIELCELSLLNPNFVLEIFNKLEYGLVNDNIKN